jgi:hypothetical protein
VSTTSRYWWTQATAAYTRAKFGHRVKLCRCCQARGLVAPLTPMHVGAECPEWNALWAWATVALHKAGAALCNTPRHSSWRDVCAAGAWLLSIISAALSRSKARFVTLSERQRASQSMGDWWFNTPFI